MGERKFINELVDFNSLAVSADPGELTIVGKCGRGYRMKRDEWQKLKDYADLKLAEARADLEPYKPRNCYGCGAPQTSNGKCEYCGRMHYGFGAPGLIWFGTQFSNYGK